MKVNMKRWLTAGVGAFVVMFVLDFIVHGKLLTGLYEQTASVWRGKGESHELMTLMTLGQVLFALVFTWIYIKGYEAKKPGLEQGVRYGLLIGLLYSIPFVSIWYVVLPIPFSLAAGWVASGLADCVAAGAVVGLLYRPRG